MKTPKPVDWKRTAREVTDMLFLVYAAHLGGFTMTSTTGNYERGVAAFENALKRHRAFEKAAKADPSLRWPKYKRKIAVDILKGYKAATKKARKA